MSVSQLPVAACLRGPDHVQRPPAGRSTHSSFSPPFLLHTCTPRDDAFPNVRRLGQPTSQAHATRCVDWPRRRACRAMPCHSARAGTQRIKGAMTCGPKLQAPAECACAPDGCVFPRHHRKQAHNAQSLGDSASRRRRRPYALSIQCSAGSRARRLPSRTVELPAAACPAARRLLVTGDARLEGSAGIEALRTPVLCSACSGLRGWVRRGRARCRRSALTATLSDRRSRALRPADSSALDPSPGAGSGARPPAADAPSSG